MKVVSPETGQTTGAATKKPSPEQDWDWEYTGVVFTCPDCGLEFSEFPPNLDLCPACGADVYQDEG